MHEQMTVAVEIVSNTGCPTLCLALEAEIGILELQGTIDLLQRHWSTSLRESIEDEHRVIVRRLGQIFG